jgi:hypothetical protein
MGFFQRLFGAGKPVTGRGRFTAQRAGRSSRGRIARPVRGKVPRGNARLGMKRRRPDKRWMKAARRRAAPPPSGLGRLLGSLPGRRWTRR